MIPIVPLPHDHPAAGVPGGLCGICAHVRVIRSGRGSMFLMCERGLRKEPGYAKYPRLPVVRCAGYEAGDA
jgi:hypothetical protein